MKLSPSQVALLHFFKSSYSGNDQSQCVGVAPLASVGLDGVAVQDTKLEGGPVITLAPTAFRTFVGYAVRGCVR
ncbi:DUF397 domain-containing protein [Streptomyces sp. A1136]|uniref:DUF397 domain-containing protein n=1 Tax=Streptomyces sp. A1136 TaxID=2563102 RepID=UPI00109E6624|nr:DUF397 domain-containing protein [Streptomyces sp. A1136]THA44639.1 DUF397 domain-containing protein [Streptomyces sp. A1136]